MLSSQGFIAVSMDKNLVNSAHHRLQQLKIVKYYILSSNYGLRIYYTINNYIRNI